MKKRILIILVLVFIIGPISRVAEAKLVACVGDSITYGEGIPDRNDNSYPAQLATILQRVDRQWETENFGVSGATLLRNGGKPYMALNAYNLALASEPDVVVIMLGSNDSVRTSAALKQYLIPDYLALIDAFAQLPSQPKIFICYPPPILWGQWAYCDPVIKGDIIPLINQVGELRDVELIDLYTPMEGLNHLFPDGIHPNTEGARMIAETVAAAIIAAQKSPDFNGDGVVDIKDLERLIESWKQADPMVDIAPEPFGDGYIDILDLEVLMSYWEQPVNDPTLIAHWALDETEGMFAADSVGSNNAIVLGGATWQPGSGQIDGALKLDGVSGYAIAGAVLNPADGPFSVLAWIKGQAQGQVIVSQQNAANWLSIDAEGNLVTELKSSDPLAEPLLSETVITDGQWHRIGLVWNGSHRTLYVDGVAIAEDTQDGLQGSGNGLNIGAGKMQQPGTYFSGLIDDLRIYNRAVSP